MRSIGFRIQIDENECNLWKILMKVLHKPTEKIKRAGLETQEGILESVLRVVRKEHAHLIKSATKGVWHARMGHCADEVFRASVYSEREI